MKQRIYALAAAIMSFALSAATGTSAQELPEGLSGIMFMISTAGKDYETIIIDGCVASNDDLTTLNPYKISTFRLYNGYGLHKEYGIININTKKGVQSNGKTGPIILVNGIEIDSLQQVRQKYVRSVKSMMPQKAMEIYGKLGECGAVLFTLHETCDGKPITMQEALSGYDDHAPAPLKPARSDTAEIRISETSSPAAPAKAVPPLTLGRAEGDNDTTYLIPDLNKVKPEDIASVMVIKDKSAQLFHAYGDTSGGVILITFKKGRMPLSAVVKAGEK